MCKECPALFANIELGQEADQALYDLLTGHFNFEWSFFLEDEVQSASGNSALVLSSPEP